MNDANHEWIERVRGRDCRFDQPRGDLSQEFHFVASLSSSTLYLERNQTYRGYCVLIYDRRHVARIDQLDANEWTELSGDLHRAHAAIWKAFSPAHMNVVSLGNLVPHLHWHLIPRYVDDPRWGNPIWPTSDTPRLILEEADYNKLADRIRRGFEQ
jgi:diadenosine tetraphosphate (Ap4A) HIT family hydrolase